MEGKGRPALHRQLTDAGFNKPAGAIIVGDRHRTVLSFLPQFLESG